LRAIQALKGAVMPCFTLAFLQALIIQIIIIAAIIAIIKLLVPFLVSITGWPILGQILMIVLWAIVAIMVVYLIFALLQCLMGSGGGLNNFRLR
jgi:surface polysaccharide O-acyltransferase-like enzyme